MKVKLTFEVNNKELNADFSRPIISFFKKATQEYDEDLYMKCFGSNAPTSKSYSFSKYFPNMKREGEKMILNDNCFTVHFSAYDLEEGMLFCNAFLGQLNKKHSFSSGSWMKLKQVMLMPSKEVTTSNVLIKFMSPFLIQCHNKETNKTRYYAYNDEGFEEKFNNVIAAQIEKFAPHLKGKNVTIKPVSPKKTVARVFKLKVTANLGLYQLTGDKEVIEFLYEAGLGSRRNAGFGLFDIVSNVVSE